MESPTEPGVESSVADCIAIVVIYVYLETVVSILDFLRQYKLSTTREASFPTT